MHCVIVAAGRGSRLGDLTSERPKCLVPFLGEPLLARTLRALEEGGCTRVTIVGGYRHDQLERYVAERPETRRLILNEDWASTNMVWSLMCAAEQLSAEPCVISYSDIFYSEGIVKHLISDSSPIRVAYDPAGLALWQARFENPLLDIEKFSLDASGTIRSIGGRPTNLAEVEGQYMGLLATEPVGFVRLSAAFASLCPERQRTVDMTTLLGLVLEQGHRLAAVPNIDPWGELDSAADIAFFEDRLRPHRLITPAVELQLGEGFAP
jgi:choline kinase